MIYSLQDQVRVRYGISKLLPINFVEEGLFLAQQLRSASVH